MRIFHNYAAEVARLVERELDSPGLFPAWSFPEARAQVPPDALARIESLMGDRAALAAVPAKSWIPELREAWRLGLIYLRDEATHIDATAILRAPRLVLRKAWIGPFSLVANADVLLRGATFSSHATVDGPSAIIDSLFRQHVVLGPYVIITRSSAEPFVKVTRLVRVDKSLLASNTSIEGSTHPEKIPLGAAKRQLGCGIGPDAWIGQHVSITNGGVVGRGVIVAAHTAITRRTGDFVFVSGNPPREFPIDFNIRGLQPEEAFDEGRTQGMMALHLPAFGPLAGAFASPTHLELDYSEHLCLRGLASENLLHFQRGVLTTAMAQLFPEHAATIAFTVGKSVRFTIELDRALAPPLYVPAEIAPALFAGGGSGGMFVEPAKPEFLASMWRSLLRGTTPLPPLEAAPPPAVAPPPVAAPPPPAEGDEVEAIVAAMVGRLTHRPGAIDPDAPFHALGMDSLVAAELSVALEARFNLTAPDVFRHNSVRKLARLIRESRLAV